MSDESLSREFRKRVERLVSDAREAGVLEELRPVLQQLIDERHDEVPLSVTPEDRPEIPMRFGMVGASPAMRRMFDLLERIVESEVAVLIQGETGTGKELVARALHDYGSRKAKPFLAENCAAVPADLLESELFGHKKGSFTGAFTDRAGHFVAADGGTVFLDEIGDMPLQMQAKLLRVLQEGEVRPVGSNKTIKVNVRSLAATNKDLRAMCAEGSFREDLYFRLNVVTISLPPLRERKGDVPHLVRFIGHLIAEEMGQVVTFAPKTIACLEAWSWPGNVRELENELRRSAALSGGRSVEPEDLSPALQPDS